MKYITIGKCTKYNIYLLISFLCEFFEEFILGLNNSNKKKPVRIFPFKAKIKNHNLLENLLRITSIFFGGVILYFIEKKNKRKDKDYEVTVEEIDSITNSSSDNKKESTSVNLIIIGFVFLFYIILDNFLSQTNTEVGFWTFEIMYISIFSRCIFKNKINRHVKLAIYIMLILGILDFIGFFLPTTKHENVENMNELTDKNVFDIIIIKYGTYVIPILFLLYELKRIQRDFCWVKSKYLMDVRSISPYKIFITIGSIGFIFIIIFFSIFTNVPCKTFHNINKIGDDYINIDTGEPLQLYKEYCSLEDYDENTKTLYLFYDSFSLITQEYSNTDKETMLEIFLIIPLLFIINVINEVSRLMMVRFGDPNNILISKNIRSFIKSIIKISVNEGDEQYITYAQFFLTETEQLISIISNMIYIEILELRFCGLDYELKKNISRRGTKDLLEIIDSMGKKNEDGDDIEIEMRLTENYDDLSQQAIE